MIPEIMLPYALYGLYGGLGQCARVFVGLYKLRLKEGSKWKPDIIFSLLSVVTGAMIGVLGGVLTGINDVQFLIPLGYAGTDAVEGLLDKKIAFKK